MPYKIFVLPRASSKLPPGEQVVEALSHRIRYDIKMKKIRVLGEVTAKAAPKKAKPEPKPEIHHPEPVVEPTPAPAVEAKPEPVQELGPEMPDYGEWGYNELRREAVETELNMATDKRTKEDYVKALTRKWKKDNK